jgi:hypothetical protein
MGEKNALKTTENGPKSWSLWNPWKSTSRRLFRRYVNGADRHRVDWIYGHEARSKNAVAASRYLPQRHELRVLVRNDLPFLGLPPEHLVEVELQALKQDQPEAPNVEEPREEKPPDEPNQTRKK